MPNDDLSDLDSEMINRLMQLAQNFKKASISQSFQNELIGEVNLDFKRTMNKIIFDKYYNEAGRELITANLILPPKVENK